MIVYARSPQEIDRMRRVEKEAEGTRNMSERFQQQPLNDGSGPLCDAYKAWMRDKFKQQKPDGRLI